MSGWKLISIHKLSIPSWNLYQMMELDLISSLKEFKDDLKSFTLFDFKKTSSESFRNLTSRKVWGRPWQLIDERREFWTVNWEKPLGKVY